MNTDIDTRQPALAGCEVKGFTRSSFLLRGAIATGSVYGVGAVAPFVSAALAAGGGGDAEILNFALTLELLEADFYNVKGKQLGLKGQAKTYATLFGEQEEEHVKALQKTIGELGGTPVSKPTFVFPVNDEASFLKLASTLENVGVGAYNGAGPKISSKEVLAAAGSIVQVEGRHAAAIDLLAGESPTPNGAFDALLPKSKVLEDVKPFIK